MKIVDLNILLYSVNRDDPHHDVARKLWENLLSSNEPVGLAWITLVGFVRLVTHPSVFAKPQTTIQAIEGVTAWLDHSNTRLVTETEDHWQALQELLIEVRVTGNLATDAHLAALAISRGATLVSFDTDFGRFTRLRWENPLS